MNIHFEQNTVGTDYFVGDLHGCYDQFMDKLREVNFRSDNDRVFSVGDLGDRGPKSLECFKLLEEPWFHAVKGNHEAFVEGSHSTHVWYMNGGLWALEAPYEVQKYLQDLVKEMPLTITVDTELGKIGIVHAESEKDWNVNNVNSEEKNLWARTKIKTVDSSNVENIDLVICGHTPLKMVVRLGNCLYIDTGAFQETGFLTMINADEAFNGDFKRFGAQFNGRTVDSDSTNSGSNPDAPAKRYIMTHEQFLKIESELHTKLADVLEYYLSSMQFSEMKKLDWMTTSANKYINI